MLLGDIEKMLSHSANCMDALYDNSKAFDTYLRKQGMDGILHKTDLKMRVRHTIVPHVRIHIVDVFTRSVQSYRSLSQRNKVPLHGPPDAIPEFTDDESWYRHVRHSSTQPYYEFSKQHFSGKSFVLQLVREIHRAGAPIKAAPDCIICYSTCPQHQRLVSLHESSPYVNDN
jgi:hypothetical protein